MGFCPKGLDYLLNLMTIFKGYSRYRYMVLRINPSVCWQVGLLLIATSISCETQEVTESDIVGHWNITWYSPTMSDRLSSGLTGEITFLHNGEAWLKANGHTQSIFMQDTLSKALTWQQMGSTLWLHDSSTQFHLPYEIRYLSGSEGFFLLDNDIVVTLSRD